MNSIDAAQPEPNHEDLNGEAAIAKMSELAKRAPTCFFCSALRAGAAFATRPMSVQRVDADGTLLFLAPTDGGLVQDIRSDAAVQLLFQASAHVDFLSLYGRAVVSQDRELIRELWDPILKTWFTGGADDPRIAVVRVQPENGYFWVTKHGRAVAFAKMVFGAAVGKTFDDSMQGRLTV